MIILEAILGIVFILGLMFGVLGLMWYACQPPKHLDEIGQLGEEIKMKKLLEELEEMKKEVGNE